MGLEEFDQWVENSANEIYWREKDKTYSNEMKQRATQYLMDWKNKITEASCVYYPALSEENQNRFPESCLRRKNLVAAMSQNTLDLYSFSFDNVDVPESYFKASHLPSCAKAGVTQVAANPLKDDKLREILPDIWQKENETYWTLYPSLPISKLKVKVDEYITDTFTAELRVCVGDIFDKMIEFGFMPCNLYGFFAGFLLKEYGISKYRYVKGEDGDTGGVMTAEWLGNQIGEYIKHKNTPIKGYQPKYIAIMTQNQHAFIQFAQEVFQIEECASLEISVNKVRTNMTRLGYPIWCYRFVDTNHMSDYLDKLADIMSLTKNSVSIIAEELGDMFCKNPNAMDILKQLLTPERGASAVESFVKGYDSGILFSLADEIQIERDDLLQKVREKITTGHGAWLWRQEAAEEILSSMVTEYKIIAFSRPCLPDVKNINTCKRGWIEKTNFLKVPVSTLKSAVEPLEIFFTFLEELIKEDEIPTAKRKSFASELENNNVLIQETFQQGEQIFKKEYSAFLLDVTEGDISVVYSKLPHQSFQLERNIFTEKVKELVSVVMADNKKQALVDKWKVVTGADSPREWSKRHLLPIMFLLPEEDRPKADFAMKTSENPKASQEDIQTSLDFLEILSANQQFQASLQDKALHAKIFRKQFLGNASNILPDISEVCHYLVSQVGSDVVSWYNNQRIQSAVAKLAEQKYHEGANQKAIAKIDAMSPEDTKAYLKQLIVNNHVVGIEIISKGDD